MAERSERVDRAERAPERLRLGVRQALILMITTAFLPAAGLAIGQAYNSVQTAQHYRDQALRQAADLAADAPRRLIERAIGALKSASLRFAEERGAWGEAGPKGCAAELRRIEQVEPMIHAAFVVDSAGVARCGSVDNFAPTDISERDSFRRMTTGRGDVVTVTDGAISKQRILLVAEPIEVDGAWRGAVTASISTALLERRLERREDDPDVRLTLVSLDQGLATTLDPAWLPEGADLLAAANTVAAPKQMTSRSGEAWFYAAAPLSRGDLVALTAWPAEDAPTVFSLAVLLDMLLPISAWALAALIVYFGANRLVVAPIRSLERLTERLRRGELSSRATLAPDTPSEFVDLGEQFDAMAAGIAQREQRLRRALQDERLLLREVYHRVKNNLQLIVSLLNLQAGSAQSEMERAILKRTQDRVLGLAMVHQNLYQVGKLSEARLDTLLEQIINSVCNVGDAEGPGGIEIKRDLDSLLIDADRAVPAAMLATEAVLNAVKHGGAGSNDAWLQVTLRRRGRSGFELTVANSAPLESSETGSSEFASGLGSRLMKGFARQLRAEMTSQRAGGSFVLTILAPDAPELGDPARAEARLPRDETEAPRSGGDIAALTPTQTQGQAPL